MHWFTLSPEEWNAVRLSVKVATWAMIGSLPFAVAIAMLLARRDFWGKSLLNAFVHLPLVLPPVVTGYILLLTFGQRGPVGGFLAEHFGIVFSFRWTGAALACAIMGFPLMVRAIRLLAEAVDRRLEQAASTLGARPAWVFITVTLPLMIPGIIAMLGYMVAIAIYVRVVPGQAPLVEDDAPKLSWSAVLAIIPITLVFFIVFGGIYGGFFTPTEGAAVGAAATFVAALLKREMTVQKFKHCFYATAEGAAMIFMIFLGADLMNSALSLTQLPTQLAGVVNGWGLSPLMVVSAICCWEPDALPAARFLSAITSTSARSGGSHGLSGGLYRLLMRPAASP